MASSRALPYLFGGLVGTTLGLAALLIAVVLGVGPFSGLLGSDGGEDARDDAGPQPTPVSIGTETPVVQARPADFSPSQDIAGGRRNAIVEATRVAIPAVVSVTVFHHQYVRRYNSPLEMLFDRQRRGGSRVERQTTEGLGSGVIVDTDGHILTNDHVLVPGAEGAEMDIFVTLHDGREFRAQLVGRAPKFDLALLRFTDPVENMPVASLGDSDLLQPGEWAIAIGSPYGELLEDPAPTVTVGVISALHRDFAPPGENWAQDRREYLDMIQTDAAINQGNSGGALVNSLGHVIGINTFIISRSGGNIGLGFAVPINRARWIMEEILEYGELRHRYAGFNAAALNSRSCNYLGLEPDTTGLIVIDVEHNSPADVAGLQRHDVIRAIGDNRIATVRDFQRLLYAARVGTAIPLTVLREGEQFQTSLTLAEPPEELAPSNSSQRR